MKIFNYKSVDLDLRDSFTKIEVTGNNQITINYGKDSILTYKYNEVDIEKGLDCNGNNLYAYGFRACNSFLEVISHEELKLF